jgi:hypothetical protein
MASAANSSSTPSTHFSNGFNGSDGLSRFLRFRAESVARLVAELAEEARPVGRNSLPSTCEYVHG